MKRSTTSLIAVLTVAAVGLTASSALAGKGGGGNKGGGFGVSFNKGGGFSVGLNKGGVKLGHGGYGGGYHNKGGFPHNKGGFPRQQCDSHGGPFGGQFLDPFHSFYVVQPGDTFNTISLKEYGTSAAAQHIARFNRLPFNSALVPGERLQLPSISPNGGLSQSRAPAPGNSPNNPFPSTPKFTQSSQFAASSRNSSTSSEPLPTVPAGSVLSVDGQEYGSEKGVVRLLVGGIALPAEVLEWSPGSAKVRLPQVDVTEATTADLEVRRADGTLAAKSAIQLTPPATSLAQKN